MKINKAIILMVSLTMALFLFAGCNMLRGAKEDVEDAGDAVARGAQDIREDWDLNTRNRTLGDINRISDFGANSRYNGVADYADTLPQSSILARSGSLGINHLVTLMDMGQDDVNTVLGTGRLMGNETANGTAYTHNMFGGHADINVDYGNDNQIKQMKVYVDNDQLTRWQTELNNRYGIAGSNQGNLWKTENVSIKMTPGTDRTEITITKNV